MRLIPLINHRLEPRAPSPGSVTVGDSVPGSTPRVGCTVVYPGVYSRKVYQGWCIYQGVQ